MCGNDEIEYVLEHLQEPERLTEPEFIEWLGKTENRELFETMRRQREAFLCHEDYGKIAVDEEYKRFVKRIPSVRRMKYKRWVAAVASVAALVAILFLVGRVEKEVPVREGEYTGKKAAELILHDGQKIKLENKLIELQEKNGMRITNDSSYQLAYRQNPADTLSGGQGEEILYNTLQIPAGADYRICLSDGTRIRLNCESEFRFPVTFSGKERKVYLSGEAFFEVSQAKEWPFIVVTDKMEVVVTGTRFNVCSYPQEQVVATTLVNGEVTIRSGEKANQTVKLRPSQQFRLDKTTGQSEVKEVDVQLYTGWTDGMFVFRNQRLEEIMDRLARWYSVEVFYAQAAVKDLRLSANLGRYEHIDSLLNVIRAMNKVNIERKGNVVIINQK